MTFDQQRLLFNPKREAGYGMYRTLDVICHEVAHQWVGDLVTMATWVSSRVRRRASMLRLHAHPLPSDYHLTVVVCAATVSPP
jgi:hypothetical protein